MYEGPSIAARYYNLSYALVAYTSPNYNYLGNYGAYCNGTLTDLRIAAAKLGATTALHMMV